MTDPAPISSIESEVRPSAHGSGPLLAASVGAIGVVFGDIGTSPLYTLQVAAESNANHTLARADVFGIISLIVWALILAVSFKYVTVVMRADNHGEGGIVAMLSLLPRTVQDARFSLVAMLVIAGAALLFGDGMITPAISVLGAVEGLEHAAPGFQPYVVPLTCAVLLGLFALQPRGTGTVGRLFGPIMMLWFVTIAGLGLREVTRNPEILGALSPTWAARYFAAHGLRGLRILGVVVLAITGGEALYADMGYFGAKAIRFSWFGVVFPSLVLCYLGQGALILRDASSATKPFFAMVTPGAPAYALVILAAFATAIASQALISGVFSLTHQAAQLGYFPRVTVIHTSHHAEGHIYVPLMNWGLMVACIALVCGFQHSERLASAYGIAVSGTMVITSLVLFEVTRTAWKWPLARSLALAALLLAFDVPFFVANAIKFVDGGYIPVVVGACFFVVMVVWHHGRSIVIEQLDRASEPVSKFLAALPGRGIVRAPGTAIYLTGTHGVPRTLSMQAERTRSVMEHIVLLTVTVDHEPRVADDRRYEIERVAGGLVHVILHFGYMEPPRVPHALEQALRGAKLDIALDDVTYFVGRATFVAGSGGEMKPFEERLFAFLARNAKGAIDHFGLPEERVIELGVRVDL